MTKNEGGKVPAIDDDRWVVRKGLVRAVACGVGAGLVMGVLYFLLAWLLQDWIRATEFGRTVYGRHYTPLVLLPFMLISLPLGWASLRLAERTSLLGGFVLLVPVFGSTVAAMAVGLGLSQAIIDPWSGKFWWVFFVSGITLPVAAGLRIWRRP